MDGYLVWPYQASKNGTAETLRPGSISGAADSAMKALEESQHIFNELKKRCQENQGEES